MINELTTKRPSHVTVATASLIGTAIEWYDFFLYGTAAALIFNKLFFPTFDPMVGTLLAFATYALGFIARPLGGLVFGHYGDKIGRKTMLYLTLLIMGVATAAIGLLPTYDTAGIWAAILLITCRLVQGFGLGGEWGGAVLMAVEHAPEDKKGFYGSWPQLGAPLGLVLGTLVFSVVSCVPDRRPALRLGLASAVPVQHRAGGRRSVDQVHDRGIARVPEGQGLQAGSENADRRRDPHVSKEYPAGDGRALRGERLLLYLRDLHSRLCDPVAGHEQAGHVERRADRRRHRNLYDPGLRRAV